MRRETVRHVLVVAALPVLLLSAVMACGEPPSESGEPLGRVGDPRTVDTSPFRMANPTTTDGATTVPGPEPTLYRPTTINPETGEVGNFGELPPSQGGPRPGQRRRTDGIRLPVTTTSTTTTTTIVIPDLPTQVYAEPACNAMSALARVSRAFDTVPPVMSSQQIAEFVYSASINAFSGAQALAGDPFPGAEMLRARFVSLSERLGAARSIEEVVAAGVWMLDARDPQFRAATETMVARVYTACPEALRALDYPLPSPLARPRAS